MERISKEQRSKIMSRIHSRNTKPEIALRKALWHKGLRFRIHYGEEKIDLAFPRRKLAIFVDGCFWHTCPIHFRGVKNNVEYWKPKLERNKQRDKLMNERLQQCGWTVLRFWEHELTDMNSVTDKIEKTLQKPG